jgi:tRNA-5-taurinomethyluridine 2-sulfurtransferase
VVAHFLIITSVWTMSSSGARRRIAMAMSGGVDSSVAAYLLQKDPNNSLMGLFMSNWVAQDDDSVITGERCSEADYKDAQKTCEHLHLPLHHASFAKEYWTTVFEPFVDAFVSGLTPNPDIDCNARIKFGAMKDYARETLGAEWIATGHYARLYHRTERPPEGVEDWMLDWSDSPLLLAGVDKSKDQSYFLATVTGKALENVDFPLGNLYKTLSSEYSTRSTVRQLALEAKLPTAFKRESMGICFVGKRNFPEFISQYLPEIPPPGVFVNVENGQVIGEHKGSWHYTIGQGAKISGALEKWFVVDRTKDTVVVCPGTHHGSLFANQVTLQSMHWIGGCLPPPLLEHGELRISCRPRHLQPMVPGVLRRNVDGPTYTIHFDGPVRALTPGQVAVVYMGDVCLGGGPILTPGPSYYELGLELPRSLYPAGHNDLSVLKREAQML